MRVLLSSYGSRGDVEPLAGLAVALQTLGAETVVSAPPEDEFTDLLARAGIPFAPAFMGVRDWVAWARESGLKLPGFAGRISPAGASAPDAFIAEKQLAHARDAGSGPAQTPARAVRAGFGARSRKR